ncbi:conserved hypothetical protein (plasmid) [Borreliella finlandensis]|uniref:Uncharacterized protein n=1 Tax=Borreliella finlandensis TaxID=498741 RepID=A0A806C770_9SPIR|nr:conserved hypothetical protein [Borreliella finlandensis]
MKNNLNQTPNELIILASTLQNINITFRNYSQKAILKLFN